MNVYDFDKTIFYPDSSYQFFFFCLKKHPASVLPVLPKSLHLAIRYRRGEIDAKPLKQQLFSFLRRLDDVEQVVNEFWRSKRHKLLKWYLSQKKSDDLIISASPEFLLAPIAQELGVRLIATKMDRRIGMIEGANCHDHEKVNRLRAEYPDEKIEAFYSDSLSDTPLAALAEKAYLVKKSKMIPWPSK